jgi:hypothetical protein
MNLLMIIFQNCNNYKLLTCTTIQKAGEIDSTNRVFNSASWL